MGRYVRSALEEQVQHNATQQSNTKDIFKLKPKCNAMQHNSAPGRYVRSDLEEKYNAMQQSDTKDILNFKCKCNTTQRNTTVHREDMWEVP